MKLSIRSLLVTVAFIALAMAALTTGGISAMVFHCIAVVSMIVAAITATVGLRRPRAVAMGFVIPSASYCLLIFAAGSPEFEPQNGSLPTSRIARYGYEALYRPIYTDMTTGEIVPGHKPNLSGFGGGGMPSIMRTVEFPLRSEFMTSAHACFLLLSGMLGALYASVLYSMQTRDQTGG